MSWLYPLVSVFIVSAISFVGIWGLAIKKGNLQKIVLHLVSFSAGALLGDSFIHLLPEAVEHSGFTLSLSIYVLLGIVISFVIEKIIWRHCHIHHCVAAHHHARPQPFAYLNLVGDGIHNFIDGLIIAASYLVSVPVGLSTTLAVILHEIPQEIGDFGVLVHGGFRPSQALFYNFLSGLAAVFGVIVAYSLNAGSKATLFLVPFAAGNFIYIACTDLLPELHKSVQIKESIIQVMMFLLGICVMVFLLLYAG